MRSESKKTGPPIARTAITLALVLLATVAVARAQTRQQPQIKPPAAPMAEFNTTPTIIVSPDEDYRIGPRDVIEVRIEDAPELSKTFPVNADGTFWMPYLNRLKAQDKTPEELGKEIADKLRGKYLKDPQVLVAVKQFNSRSFFIAGAVQRPGVYQIEGHPSLFKLITVAGGLRENFGSTAFIIREVKDKKSESSPEGSTAIKPVSTDSQQPASQAADAVGNAEYSVKTVNITGMLKGRIEQNTYLEPGDFVNIPPADVFYVAGEVNAPGSFPLSEGTTLRQAMALAQGATFNAAAGDGVILRTDVATGRREEIKVDIGAVMKNKKQDVLLQANDIVMVPNSKGKTIGNAILKAFGLGAAQRGPYRY
ncbi:MAG TPA: polysaccharide biosynthesis/export family protein [Blastocatellia bacterium]|jgi:polysaccharide export outer membrane protein|nr:polysaccharide biosynthesis/export family protein [Blastocatellia bacterium]